MSTFFIFDIKRAKTDRIFNFLMESFSVMSSLIDMIFGVFSKTNVKILKYITLQFSQNIARAITY